MREKNNKCLVCKKPCYGKICGDCRRKNKRKNQLSRTRSLNK